MHRAHSCAPPGSRTGRLSDRPRSKFMSLFIHAPRMGLPCVTDPERASRAMADLRDRSMASSDPDLVEWVRAIADDPMGRHILESIFSNSPFLTAMARTHSTRSGSLD